MSSTNSSSKTSIKRLTTAQSWSIIVVILIIIGLGFGYWFHYQHQWRSLGQVSTTGDQAVALANKSAKTSKITYEIYYRDNCPDCRQLVKKKIPYQIHRQLPKSYQVTLFDDGPHFKKARKARPSVTTNHTTTWLHANYVTAVPSVIVKYKGYPIYMYSGTNLKKWHKLSRGINPATGKRFVKKIPHREIVENSFDHSTDNFVSVKVSNATNTNIKIGQE